MSALRTFGLRAIRLAACSAPRRGAAAVRQPAPAANAVRFASGSSSTSPTSTATTTTAATASASGERKVVIERGPPRRDGETTEQLRARLVYQSRKRGIKENDLIFSTFAQKYLADFDEAQLKEYDTILNEHDNEWDMYAWYTERVPLPEYLKKSQVMHMVIEHVRNDNREGRARMPPLNS